MKVLAISEITNSEKVYSSMADLKSWLFGCLLNINFFNHEKMY